MTPEEIDTALLKLAPDAIACIERTLRGTMKVNQAITATAWKVLDLARKAGSVEKPDVDQEKLDDLANVLQLVTK
jgi:hypothetical protein|tara:strand:+ start:2904 stop:3128 length:225 start_codon:yes stop_codon:yes gene_type:complete